MSRAHAQKIYFLFRFGLTCPHVAQIKYEMNKIKSPSKLNFVIDWFLIQLIDSHMQKIIKEEYWQNCDDQKKTKRLKLKRSTCRLFNTIQLMEPVFSRLAKSQRQKKNNIWYGCYAVVYDWRSHRIDFQSALLNFDRIKRMRCTDCRQRRDKYLSRLWFVSKKKKKGKKPPKVYVHVHILHLLSTRALFHLRNVVC